MSSSSCTAHTNDRGKRSTSYRCLRPLGHFGLHIYKERTGEYREFSNESAWFPQCDLNKESIKKLIVREWVSSR